MSEFVAGRDGGDKDLTSFESDFGVLRLIESREIRENGAQLVGQLRLLIAHLFDQRDHLNIEIGWDKWSKNVYRGCTSDATTSSSLILPSFRMSFDDFYPQKRPYLTFENNTGHTDGRTDGRTNGRTDTTSYRDA